MLRWAEPVAVVELEASRHRRRRAAGAPQWPAKPLQLAAEERALLGDWARGSAGKRPWMSLLQQAGIERLELAERLADRLLALGVCTLTERFAKGRWERQDLQWRELPALQTELGLPTAAARQAERQQASEQLSQLLGDSLLGEAAAQLESAKLGAAHKQARAELLLALRAWTDEQRSGMHRDFALFARPHTKAVSSAEWNWLAQAFDLEALGISGFAPLLWLAGDMQLHWPEGSLCLAASPFLGLPSARLSALQAVSPAPRYYWLIENRASFERQAASREAGCCLLWTAGRPASHWLRAVRALLALAPAPCRVSADLDPAGIALALAAVSPWVEAGQSWQPQVMAPEQLSAAKRQALGDWDQACLARLLANPAELGPLAPLAQALQSLAGKAEQEGWL